MHTHKPFVLLALLTVQFMLSLSAYSTAAEISLIHGVYKQSEVKDGLSKSDISLGGRYSEQFAEHQYWFAQADLSIKTYSGGSPTPSNSNNLSIAGGMRQYFDRFSERIAPFASAVASFKDKMDATQQLGSVTEVSLSGLYYGADLGMRFSLSTDFFLDLSTPIFESALFATEKTTVKTQDNNGNTTETTQEISHNELYINTQGAFASLVVSFGMRL